MGVSLFFEGGEVGMSWDYRMRWTVAGGGRICKKVMYGVMYGDELDGASNVWIRFKKSYLSPFPLASISSLR